MAENQSSKHKELTERIREELFKCFKHDTLKTLKVLSEYSLLNTYIFRNNELWLKPTTEQ